MIQETCVVISHLEKQAVSELEARYARRNKIRYIDDLINEFEILNLSDEAEIPADLHIRVAKFISGEGHPIVNQSMDDVRVAEWMEALYDVQDTLMLPADDELD